MGNRNMWTMSKKLLRAISAKHDKYLTLSTKQFMGIEKQPHSFYILSEAVYNEETGRYFNKEIYSTTSMIRITLYLRDIYYSLEGMELPEDQVKWNEIRKELMESGQYWPWNN